MPIHILSDTINNGNLVSDYLRNRWPLTYDANDIISANNLTNNGTVTFSGQGASFNGSNQWLNCNILPPIIGAISFWTKTRSYSTGPRNGWMIASSPYNITSISVNSSGSMSSCYLTPSGSCTSIIANIYNSTYFPMTSYTHLLLTWDIYYAYSYRNGIKYSVNVPKGTATPHENFSIGRTGLYTGEGGYYNGYMLDYRIYDGITLTTEMVQNIYLAGPNMIYQSPKIQNRIISYRR